MKSDQTPLPHLVGPPPLSKNERRGKAAFAFSLASWGAVIAGLLLIIAAIVAGKGSTTLMRHSNAGTTFGLILMGFSHIAATLGTFLGLIAYKTRRGKAAFFIGLSCVLAWVTLYSVFLHRPYS